MGDCPEVYSSPIGCMSPLRPHPQPLSQGESRVVSFRWRKTLGEDLIDLLDLIGKNTHSLRDGTVG